VRNLPKQHPSPRRTDLRKLIEDGWAAREHLITANSRLVISVPKSTWDAGVPFLDLIQEGNIGLNPGPRRIRLPARPQVFNLCTWWIRQA